jgi:riboflavin synthase
MFTGIIEETGAVAEPGHRLKVRCNQVLQDTKPGASIAVNGVCLTAVRLDADGFWADLAPETLARTNLGDLKTGSLVNLERALAAGERLSGHIVQGHVDGTAVLRALHELPDSNWWLEIDVPPELERYMIFKGSVAIDGISLTVAALESGRLSVAIIPHTYACTALREKHPGDRVNIEVDLIAKYVEKLVAPHAAA